MTDLTDTFFANQITAAGFVPHTPYVPRDVPKSGYPACSFNMIPGSAEMVQLQDRDGGMMTPIYEVWLHNVPGLEDRLDRLYRTQIDPFLNGQSWTIMDGENLFELTCDKIDVLVLDGSEGGDETRACGARYQLTIQPVIP